MKYLYIIFGLFLVTFNKANFAQTSPNKYYGGNNDGYSVLLKSSSLLNGNLTDNRNHGGNNDGNSISFSSSLLLNGISAENKNHGGSHDGFSKQISLNILLNGINADIRNRGGDNDGSFRIQENELLLNGTSTLARSHGGINDGHSKIISVIRYLDGAIPREKYMGGIGDGFYSITTSNYLLDGTNANLRNRAGSGDGYGNNQSLALFLDGYLLDKRFRGGSYDGHTFFIISSVLLNGTSANLRFKGSSHDGFSSYQLAYMFLDGSNPNFKFRGGNEDGYKMNSNDNSEPLPVEIVSFEATRQSNQITISWKTATETNNYGFEIERAANALGINGNTNWQKIGFVVGLGNSNSPKDYKFIDKYFLSGMVKYRLKQVDFDGSYKYGPIVQLFIEAPREYVLEQNYPNPYNPATTISYSIIEPSNVSLKVYDVLGNEVTTLVEEFQQAGTYSSQFSISNLHLSSGIYFYTLRAGNFVQTKKMILIK